MEATQECLSALSSMASKQQALGAQGSDLARLAYHHGVRGKDIHVKLQSELQNVQKVGGLVS